MDVGYGESAVNFLVRDELGFLVLIWGFYLLEVVNEALT